MQNGLYILDHGDISAGWVNGSIMEIGVPVPNVEIKSTLNEKSFYSDAVGDYSFGFPQGTQEFNFFLDGEFITTRIITILPHQTASQDIILGVDAGDVNGDGFLNILDIVTLVNWIILNEFSNSGDLNSDGQLNILDVVQLVNLILS